MKNQRGQSIVELTLMTPLILIALYIPIDFAMMFSAAKRTQEAVREVARIGAAQQVFDQTSLQAELTSRLTGYSTTNPTDVTLLTSGPANCAKTIRARATIAYPFFFYRMMNWFGANIPQTRTISREAYMRSQAQPSTNTSTACTP